MWWLVFALVWAAFIASVVLAGWMLNRPKKPARPLSIAEELVAYKMANEKYRGLSAKQRATLNRKYRAATRPHGGGVGPY
jgi:hypothetical protein